MLTQPDLFGEPQQQSTSRGGRHYVKPWGYFAPPGTGPEGHTCGDCMHIARFRRYAKCELARGKWTNGRASDVLSRSPACREWEAQPIESDNQQPVSREATHRRASEVV
jgi:hypothetical protein